MIYTQQSDYPADHPANNIAAALCGLVLAYGEDQLNMQDLHRSALRHALAVGGDDVLDIRETLRHAPESMGVIS